jgi:hypothetical protein
MYMTSANRTDKGSKLAPAGNHFLGVNSIWLALGCGILSKKIFEQIHYHAMEELCILGGPCCSRDIFTTSRQNRSQGWIPAPIAQFQTVKFGINYGCAVNSLWQRGVLS